MIDEKIIIDTDIGDDVDDLFAIISAVNYGANILGITTVFRNTAERAKMTKYFLDIITDKKIPIYAGENNPQKQVITNLLPKDMIDREMVKGYYELPQYKEEMDKEAFEKESAIEFIRKTIMDNPGEVVIYPIGCMTNIALAMKKYPEIIPNIKEIRFIGGNYEREFPEWNIICDPDSASEVINSGVKIYAVGVDQTMKCPAKDEHLELIKNSNLKIFNEIDEAIAKWRKHYNYDRPIFHDVLIFAAFYADCVKFEKRKIKVETCGNKIGMTLNDANAKYEINVAVNVDTDKFYNYVNSNIFDIKKYK